LPDSERRVYDGRRKEIFMRLLVLAAFLASSTASAPPPAAPAAQPPAAEAKPRVPAEGVSSSGQPCRRPDMMMTGPKEGEAPGAKRLGELPSANLMLAVYDEVEGCMEPRVVRYGIGEGAR
jgi:hypothetical protein